MPVEELAVATRCLDGRELQKKVIGITQGLFSQDAEEKVHQTVKQFNNIVRERIRVETGLKLSDGKEATTLRVAVVDGYPVPVAQLIAQKPDPVLWFLVVHDPLLQNLQKGAELLCDNWEELEGWHDLPPEAADGRRLFHLAGKAAEALRRAAFMRELSQNLKKLNLDILGVYHSRPEQGPNIELYWMAISLVALMLGVSFEAVTIVALAHELVHGYTHVGRDIDGDRWPSAGFAKSDLRIIEGLAQFYTELVVESVARRSPGCEKAFSDLLAYQGEAYTSFSEWLKGNESRKRESVRYAMLEGRSREPLKYEDWLGLLDAASGRLTQSRNKGQRELF